MRDKLRIAVLFGGQSAEHEISIMSAHNIVNALDPKKYDIIPIGIAKDGKMYLQQLTLFKDLKANKQSITQNLNNQVTIVPGNGHGLLINLLKKDNFQVIDVIFPALHGPYGEDGVIQGLVRSANIPIVGSDVLGSAICMDKDVAKRLLREAGIPVADFITLRKHASNEIDIKTIIKKLGLPCFVKPANLGSAIGVVKAINKDDLLPAIEYAFQFDTKIIIEKFVDGREIECAVLGNDEVTTSLPGEIITKDFYSYEAKYFDDELAKVIPTADLDKALQKKIQALSVQAFHCLECKGMARVDFFIDNDNNIYLNEVNTIPGFTSISQYPKMWEASGLSCGELLSRLIELARKSYDDLKSLKSSP